MNVTLLPSAADASFTDNVAASLALIVPSPAASLIVTPVGNPLVGSVSLTVNHSLRSVRASSIVATVIVFISPVPVAPAAKVSVPLVLVKSDCSAVGRKLPRPSRLVAKSTVTSALGLADRVTVNVTLLPSSADASSTDSVWPRSALCPNAAQSSSAKEERNRLPPRPIDRLA